MRKQQMKKIIKLCVINGNARDRENFNPFGGLDEIMSGCNVIDRARVALEIVKPEEYITDPEYLEGFREWKSQFQN